LGDHELTTSMDADRESGVAVAVSRASLFDPTLDNSEDLVGERDSQLSPWAWEIDRDTLFCTPDFFRLHGLRTWPSTPGEEPVVTAALPLRALWGRIFSESDRTAIRAFLRRVRDGGEGGAVEYRVARGSATRTLITRAVIAERQPRRVIGYTQDVTELRQAHARHEDVQRALERQRALLDGIGRGRPLSETLEAVCRHLEAELPGAACAIMLLDREAGELRHPAMPSLPAA
jgi:hypothetical protein